MNPVTEIITAAPEDAEGIVTVQRVTWLATYPNEAAGITEADILARLDGGRIAERIARWQTIINQVDRPIFVAKQAGKVVGFVAPRYDGEKDQQRLGALYVLPEAQGSGLGRQLLARAIESMDRSQPIFLHVVAYNERAIKFYEKNGFVLTGKTVTDGVSAMPSGAKLPEVEMVLR